MYRLVRCLVFALMLGSAARDAASDTGVSRLTLPAQDLNAEFSTPRIPPSGLVLRFRGAASESTPDRELSLTLHTARPRVAFAPDSTWGSKYAKRILLRSYEGKNAVAANTWLVKRRARGWRVYVDGRLSASFPDIFAGEPVELLHEKEFTLLDEDGEDDVFLQRVAPFRFTDDFLIDETNEQSIQLGHWERRSGEWLVHSVADTVRAENVPPERHARQRRERLPQADRSPNFYCVEGSGSNALLLTGHDFYDRYTLSAAVHAGEGENGIAFLASPEGGFHALTASLCPDEDGLRFTLWNTRTGTLEDRQILARSDTDLLPGQWHLLSVTLHEDRIIARVNQVPVFQIVTDLPPSGRFGLFAHGPGSTRFDDVEAFSHEELFFETVSDFRQALLFEQGSLGKGRGALPLAKTPGIPDGTPPPEHIRLKADPGKPALALFGAVTDGAHVLATAVTGEGRPFEAALVTAWQGADAAAIRLVLRQTATERLLLLQEALGGIQDTKELGRWAIPAEPSKTPIELMLDATEPDGVLRAYVDGRLVLIAPEIRPWGGASGFLVPAGGQAGFALPFYGMGRILYRNKFEKNETFVSDPFMRHWASPEGEWVTLKDGLTWLKGDLFGAVSIHLPWVETTRLHLAVPEGESEGSLQLVAAGGSLSLELPQEQAEDTSSLPSVPADALAWQPANPQGTESNRWYAIQLEDHVLWARSGDEILFTHSLPEPPSGRGVRVEGLTVKHLGLSRVERTGVVDFLFTESLYEWTLNGGVWEVVNRFQCDPRWSHLNGQNADSLAALWSRYEFEGDFCVEMYSGMRHGWYDRSGDLNLTVLGNENSPASGYSFVCTGWDPDESQMHSRLFRNGEMLARSDQYLVPRAREGNVRRGYTPLIAAGRDVHGAWYYTVMRRTGSTLQVFFDHEPVFTLEDPDPLPAGGLGIWTYRNSIMVARVKMAAQTIRPRRFHIVPVDPSAPAGPHPSAEHWPAECEDPIAAMASAAGVASRELDPSAWNPRYPALPEGIALPSTTNAIPLAFWTPDAWAPQDPASLPRLDWRPTASAPDAFLATARQAGGSFFTTNTLPAVPLRDLAGWRFEIARTDDAHINFNYTVGRMSSSGFEPAQSFFHRLSGSDETRGPLLRSGATPVPAASARDRVLEGPWSEVQVWLPAFPREEETLWVRIDGFGTLQPSDEQQGLHGNRPGAAYAVRGFAPILLGAPVLAPSSTGEDDALRNAIAERTSWDLHRLALPPDAFPLPATMHWVVPPANLGLSASWSQDFHDQVEIRSEIPWPVRHLKGVPVTVNGQNAVVIPREGNLLHVVLPRNLSPDASGFYAVELVTNTRRPIGWRLSASGRDSPAPPVLLSLESNSFQLQNFEQDPTVPSRAAGGTIRWADPVQGTVLRTSNAGRPQQRLVTPLLGSTDLARNPVIQFRYRAEPMSRVSLRMERLGDIAFTETPPHTAPSVRGHNPGLSEDWATWTGIVTDGIAEQPYGSAAFLVPSGLTLQSGHRFDQTGRYSTLLVDDLVAGPAIGPHRPLVITPHLLDLDGDGYVEWTIAEGVEPLPSDTETSDSLATHEWTRTKPGLPVSFALDDRKEGLHQVLFRPASPRATGPATRIPILLDRTPLQLSHAFEQTPGAGNGSLLTMHFNTQGGSAPFFESLDVSCEEQSVDLRYGSVRAEVSAQRATLRIDWPLLLQSQIQQARDGDTLGLVFDGLQDGAGNPSDAYTVPIPIRYAEDHTPPAIRTTILPPTIAWMSSWTESIYSASFRTVSHCTQQMVPATTNHPATLQIQVRGPNASATEPFQRQVWKPDRFPFLALRVGFAKLPQTMTPDTLRLVLQYRRQGDSRVRPFQVNLLTDPSLWPDSITGTADWTEGGTSELQINVRELLRRQEKPDVDVHSIVGIRFEFNQAIGAQFQIHHASICAPWGETDEWTVRAYDASGIAGLTWAGAEDTPSESLTLQPAAMSVPEDDSRWLRVRVLDRAGNATHPIVLPLPPRTTTPR